MAPAGNVLVLNTGSSSIKYQVVNPDSGERLAKGIAEEITDHVAGLAEITAALDASGLEFGAVGHRVVHGGESFSEPMLIDDEVIAAIRDLIPLAPLHNPANLAGIEAARAAWPDLPQVAVFDTAFHRTLPEHAYRYAVPEAWYRDYGVRRYGFHGTSHQHVANLAAEVLGRPLETVDLIVAHLGNGASMSAIEHGRCVDTSMGLSPLEGLVMGTRSGDIDPAIVGHVATQSGRTMEDVAPSLNRESGLKGLCGASDLREIEARVDAGDEAARRALEVYCYRIKKYLGAYLAVLDGCDAVVFTAGIGENSARVRAMACTGLDRLGIVIDAERNERGDDVISTDESPITVLRLATDEELAIARQTAAAVAAAVGGR